MTDAILRTVFPAVQVAREVADEHGPTEDDVRAALREELDLLVQASWREHQTKRRPDEHRAIAR